MLLLGRLAVHYYRPDFTPAAAKSMVEDMADDLGEFTLAEIEVAIRAYRLDASERFFPRSANLRELVLAERSARRESATGAECKIQFGESRPLMWWTKPKTLWARHWREGEIPADCKGENI